MKPKYHIGRWILRCVLHATASLALALLWIALVSALEAPDNAARHHILLIGRDSVDGVDVAINGKAASAAQYVDSTDIRVFYFSAPFVGNYASGENNDKIKVRVYSKHGDFVKEFSLYGQSREYTGDCLYILRILENKTIIANECRTVREVNK